MLVATHGRALWILDHLEPIQEYRAATAAGDAKLYAIPTALEWKSKNNLNEEFWGHQYFIGENPSFDALINFQVNKALPDLKFRITDGAGKFVRELDAVSRQMQPGIQTICWDMRVEPLTGDEAAAAGGRAGGGGRGGRGGTPAVPGVPVSPNAPGYLPMNPCTGEPSGGSERVAGGGGAAPANIGPQVVPGSYNVALVSGGKTLDTKSIKVIMDPGIPAFTDAVHRRWNEVILDLQEAQSRGNAMERKLAALNTPMVDAVIKLRTATNVPDAVKTQFADVSRQFDSVKVKFGVGAPPAAGRGGRGGADPSNALARTGAAKTAIMGIWETPSAGMLKQSSEAKAALTKAIADADALMPKLSAVSAALKKYDIAIPVPAGK
jgi:hypothetical protein